ncbi:hypothetical protein CFP56_013178 [Quercus suber]|uniref:Uncharacterized protein n=1 Tax=Quercus suber TaxID=58331 RepID=A0AAW0KX53_QUESU
MNLYKGVAVISLYTQHSNQPVTPSKALIDKDSIKGPLMLVTSYVSLSAFYILQCYWSYLDNSWTLRNDMGEGKKRRWRNCRSKPCPSKLMKSTKRSNREVDKFVLELYLIG